MIKQQMDSVHLGNFILSRFLPVPDDFNYMTIVTALANCVDFNHRKPTFPSKSYPSLSLHTNYASVCPASCADYGNPLLYNHIDLREVIQWDAVITAIISGHLGDDEAELRQAQHFGEAF